MASERVLPSEFDFAEQALFYVPAALPDVRDAGISERAAEEIVRLLEFRVGVRSALHQLQPDERFVRTCAHARAISAADAGLGAAHGPA
jgi:hypothetical protein